VDAQGGLIAKQTKIIDELKAVIEELVNK